MEIRPIKNEEWTDAMALAWRTFIRFEADVYTPEGTKNFYKFITSTDLEKMFYIGEYKAFGAFEQNKIVGILGLRNETFLSLLFVDEEYHHRGIGTALVAYLVEHFYEVGEKRPIFVNSSPYAVGFYHHIGFKDVSPEETKDGITFTTMKLEL